MSEINEANIYHEAMNHDKYWQALKDAYDYLNTDKLGMAGFKRIIDNIEKAKKEEN